MVGSIIVKVKIKSGFQERIIIIEHFFKNTDRNVSL